MTHHPNMNRDHIMGPVGELVGVHTYTPGEQLNEEQRRTIANKLNQMWGHTPGGTNYYLQAVGENEGPMKLSSYVNPLLP